MELQARIAGIDTELSRVRLELSSAVYARKVDDERMSELKADAERAKGELQMATQESVSVRAQLAQGNAPGAVLDDAMDAAINGVAALYFWEVHKGALPEEIGRVRSWDVRDWMKEHGFKAEAFPGMHLRDEVVERLRMYGLQLTPKPLTHTAWEYYNMHYDRHADENGPLGRRRQRPAEEPAEDEAAAEDEVREEKKRGGLFGFGKKADAAEAYEPDDLPAAEPQAEVLTGDVVDETEALDLGPEAVGERDKPAG